MCKVLRHRVWKVLKCVEGLKAPCVEGVEAPCVEAPWKQLRHRV